MLLFTPFTVTFANPFKIRFANGICSHLNHFLTDFAVNAKSCVNSNDESLHMFKHVPSVPERQMAKLALRIRS